MAQNTNDPTRAAFIAALVPDPNEVREVRCITGYLGASSEEGYTRFYADAQLCNYFEIPNDAILFVKEVPEHLSRYGECDVWILKDAELIHGKVGTERTKDQFLEGQIYQDYLKKIQFQAGTPFGVRPHTNFFTQQGPICSRPIQYCPPLPPPSAGALFCPTPPGQTTGTCCVAVPTPQPPPPSLPGAFCPTPPGQTTGTCCAQVPIAGPRPGPGLEPSPPPFCGPGTPDSLFPRVCPSPPPAVCPTQAPCPTVEFPCPTQPRPCPTIDPPYYCPPTPDPINCNVYGNPPPVQEWYRNPQYPGPTSPQICQIITQPHQCQRTANPPCLPDTIVGPNCPPFTPNCPPNTLAGTPCPPVTNTWPFCTPYTSSDPTCPLNTLSIQECPPRTLYGPTCPPGTLTGPTCPPNTLYGPTCPPITAPGPTCPNTRNWQTCQRPTFVPQLCSPTLDPRQCPPTRPPLCPVVTTNPLQCGGGGYYG